VIIWLMQSTCIFKDVYMPMDMLLDGIVIVSRPSVCTFLRYKPIDLMVCSHQAVL